MTEVNRCVYLDSSHKLSLVEKEIKRPLPDEVIVRIMANGICGSDIHFYHEGRLGNFVVTAPYIPGHEASGIIEEVGERVKDFSRGDHVVIEPGIPCGVCGFCRMGRYNLCREVIFLSEPSVNGTFCDYVSIRRDSVHRIPKDMPFEHAALAEPAAVAIHAVNRAMFKNGDSAVIIGAGPIGLLTLQAFKAAGGGRAICIDGIGKRLETAKRLGADEIIDIRYCKTDMRDIADVVFETAGSSKASENMFRLARHGGCAVQVGWPDKNSVPMDIACFLDKELVYVAVNRYANVFPTAISWIYDGRINVRELITHEYSLEQTAEAFKFSLENKEHVIKTVVTNII